MENIHKILNYSFAPMDISNYIDMFISDRRGDMKRLSIACECNDVHYDEPYKIASVICEIYFKEPVKISDPPNGFDTYEMLGAIMQENAQKCISSGRQKILNALQKKFEVNHRIFDSYDSELMRNSDSSNSIQVYAMLSALLSLRYMKDRNLNDFNTAVKLNDLLLKSGWTIGSNLNYAVCLLLCIEHRIMEELNGL